MVLTEKDNIRYYRQIQLAEIGETGQEKLKNSSVLVVGVGGLGSPALMYLAGAGIGTIGIMDRDCVDSANLHRQVIHTTEGIGMLKTDSAETFIKKLNPEIRVEKHNCFFEESTAGIADNYDFIISAVDTLKAKHYINKTCVRKKKPFCHGGVNGYEGQVFTYLPKQNSFCLRCISEPPSEEEPPAGLLGTIPGIIGVMQASESIHFLVHNKTPLSGTLLVYNGFNQTTRKLQVNRNPECPACGTDRRKTDEQ